MIDDFGSNDTLRQQYSDHISAYFDDGVDSVNAFLAANGGGSSQFYNPLKNGQPSPDLALPAGDITWNGFPKRFLGSGATPTNFAAADVVALGQARQQDEYLEWHVSRNAAGKITEVQFTCEAWDYFLFLANRAPDKVVALYKTFVNPAVVKADLFTGGAYNRLNKWNTTQGAMHLTHPANNLYAEVFLAATASVRRTQGGVELTSAGPLIQCAQFGAENRNSDPNIGIQVNTLARQKRMITLGNPTGLYMAGFDGNGVTLDGVPAGGFFQVVRGTFPMALRAVYKLPSALAAAGKTVSDVKIGGNSIEFGGQLAQRITMHLFGVASVATTAPSSPVAGCVAVDSTNNPPVGLGPAAGPPPNRTKV